MSWPVDDRRGLRRPGATRAARPASVVYGALARTVKLAHDAGLKRPHRATKPVVSIGGITVGGAGKTPIVRWLAESLAAAGRNPAVLSRGYRGTGGATPRVVDPRTPDVARDGDEPALLARSLPNVAVIAGTDRVAGARLAISRGADLLLLDDGFQHRRLHRDLDVVLWDRKAERSEGRLLPDGLLREPLEALDRADALILVDRGDGFPSPPPRGPEPTGRLRLVPAACQPLDSGARLYAVSGLADPESFEHSLVELGFTVVGAMRFPDHHAFTGTEIRDAEGRAAGLGADLLAVTAKDWVRWPRSERRALPVPAVFDLDVEVVDGDLVELALALGRESR
ncbi:MAG: tetraacyldisaccharide 4'-kinase [bacterium]